VQLLATVNLIRALGGGWEDSPHAPNTPVPDPKRAG
jgi:outer membrane protein TolC